MPAKKFKLLGLLVLLVAVNSQALTLGRLRGVALVGQALDVAVQVQMDADETPASLCFEADVFHADTRQEPSRVQVSVEPTQIAQAINVRVQSPGLIDEPVVTVYLRAGCTQKTSRRYVLLADIASEPAAPVAPRLVQTPLITPLPAAASAPGRDSAGAPAGTAAAGPGTGGSAASRAPVATAARLPKKARPVVQDRAPAATTPARKPGRPKAVAAPAPAKQVDEKLQAGRTAGQSRLKLDPLEVLSERVATLESSTASAPVDVAAREAREAQRIAALESNVKNLLALASRNETSLGDLKARLRQAESERYLNPMVYGLIALLLACVALIGFVLLRRGKSLGGSSGNWWSGATSVPPTVGSPETGPGTIRPSGFSPMSAPGALASRDAQEDQTQRLARAGPRSLPAPITQVDVSLVEMSESTFDRLMQSGVTHNAVRKPRPADAAQSDAAGHRKSINSEELFDIRQQAEFFVSLGQTDQAVRILENRISASGESSPLAYLDLLKIFHALGLRADFRQVREDFNLLFNARVPEFSNFLEEGRSLEEYPEAISGIVAAWGSPHIFATIETSLFRDQWNTQHELFDLAAFRDLLLLHAVAQAVMSASEGGTSLPGALTDHGPRVAYPAFSATAGSSGAGSVRPPSMHQAGAGHGDVPLPTLDGVPELDIDLSDLHVPQAVPSATRLAQQEGGLSLPSGAGNLIDFDLPDAPAKRRPKGA